MMRIKHGSHSNHSINMYHLIHVNYLSQWGSKGPHKPFSDDVKRIEDILVI